MRILHCLDSIDPALAGPVEAARQFSIAGQQHGHTVEVVSLDSSVEEWAGQWPVPVTCVGGGWTTFRYNPALTHWLRENSARYDAVVVHGIFKYHLIAAWKALKDGPVPYFVIFHGMLNPWFKDRYPLKHLKKAVFWHSCIHPAIRKAEAVLYLCEEEARLAPMSFRIEAKRTEIVPLGITGPEDSPDPEIFLAEHPELRGKRVVLFLGRICVMKSCDLLIESFSRMCRKDENLRLVIAGPDSEGLQTELIRETERLGIREKVVWPGPLYRERKWAALQAADAFILPSHCETFPVAVLEALSCSTPVLISRKVNIYREVERHAAGLFFEDNVEEICEALSKWAVMPYDQREQMRENSRECFDSEFEISRALEMHIQAYRGHLAEAQSKTGQQNCTREAARP